MSVSEQVVQSWQAQNLRLTVFYDGQIPSGIADDLWLRCTGMEPEVDEKRPREGIRRQAGTFQERYFEVVVASDRIDWQTTCWPAPYEIPTSDESHFEFALPRFANDASHWLSKVPQTVKRLAVGAIGILYAADKVGSYKHLKGSVRSVDVDPVNSLDFFYQINWPVNSSAVPGVRLNRATRWTAQALGGVSLLMPNDARVATPVVSGNLQHYCRLECDHNTPAEHPLPMDAKLDRLATELCELATLNFRHGEIRSRMGIVI